MWLPLSVASVFLPTQGGLILDLRMSASSDDRSSLKPSQFGKPFNGSLLCARALWKSLCIYPVCCEAGRCQGWIWQQPTSGCTWVQKNQWPTVRQQPQPASSVQGAMGLVRGGWPSRKPSGRFIGLAGGNTRIAEQVSWWNIFQQLKSKVKGWNPPAFVSSVIPRSSRARQEMSCNLSALMASCGEGVHISLGLSLSPAECVCKTAQLFTVASTTG